MDYNKVAEVLASVSKENKELKKKLNVALRALQNVNYSMEWEYLESEVQESVNEALDVIGDEV